MTPSDAPLSDARKWLHEVDKVLRAAKLLLQTDEPEPSRSVFHSQQAAEKAAKAFLIFRGVSFRRTHDLVLLGIAGQIGSLLKERLQRGLYIRTLQVCAEVRSRVEPAATATPCDTESDKTS